MDEALKLLDAWLDLTRTRSMFSGDEIQDGMLDIRAALTREPEIVPPADEPTLEPVA